MNEQVNLLSTATRRVACVLAAGILAVASAAVVASQRDGSRHQALEDIRLAVADFLMTVHGAGEHLAITPGNLDRRLRLGRCETPLSARFASGSGQVGRVTVEVRCTGIRPWRLYVPSQVSLFREVVVAARPLARGQRLGAADLRLERRDLAKAGDHALRDPRRVMGYVVTRPVRAGRVLSPRLLQAPQLVQRGQRVRLVAEGAGIHISMAGQALEAGALGETVRVRNPASRRVVDAVVTGPGQVALQVSAPVN